MPLDVGEGASTTRGRGDEASPGSDGPAPGTWRSRLSGRLATRAYCLALNCVAVFFFSSAPVNTLSRQSEEPSFLSCTVTG